MFNLFENNPVVPESKTKSQWCCKEKNWKPKDSHCDNLLYVSLTKAYKSVIKKLDVKNVICGVFWSSSFTLVFLKFFEPIGNISCWINKAHFHFSSIAHFLGVSHTCCSKNVSDLVDGSVELWSCGRSTTKFNQDILNILNALSLYQKSLDIFFGFFKLSFQLSVFFFDVFIVLVQLFILISEQKNLFLLFLNVADQIWIRLVCFVEQWSGNFELIFYSVKLLFSFSQSFKSLFMLPLFGLKSLS